MSTPFDLYVEGTDDLHTITHILRRHGITLDRSNGPVIIKPASGDRRLLDLMATAIPAAIGSPVGFVLDTDVQLQARWQQIKDTLKPTGLNLSDLPEGGPPENGLIARAEPTNTTVGLWLMPDNKTNLGRLEDLVQTLVPAGDDLLPHAKSATSQAINLGASFAPQNKIKADLCCWLAWQKDPGLPYGSAINAKFLSGDSEAAKAFVKWFRKLYGLENN